MWFDQLVLGLIVFAIGASVGSFLNVVADRTPAGRSLVSPRSYCSSCKRPISNTELVPVLSYLWLRGRCRHCGAAIPIRVVLVEATTGLLFAVAYLQSGFGVEFVVLASSVSLLIVVAVIDWEHQLILNRIVLPSTVAALIVAPFWNELGLSRAFLGSSSMIASLLNSLLGGLGAFLLFLVIILVYPQGMGGGDVKYAGLLGLILGLPGVLLAWWITAILGGIVAVALLALRKKGRKDAIPYGPFLSIGGIVVLLGGSDMLSGYQQLVERIVGV